MEGRRRGVRWTWLIAAFAVALALLAACGDDDDDDNDNAFGGDGIPDIELTSEAFEDRGPIPEDFTCDGRDHSPPLRWGDRPDEAASLAIIMDDLDVSFIHWVVYDIDPELSGLDRISQTETLPGSDTPQGTNSFGDFGYGGPCPPGEQHTYRFRLFVLDTELGLDPGASVSELDAAMDGHIIAQGELTGTYAR